MGELIFLKRRGDDAMREITAYDVSKAFLSLCSMSPKKLQKMCYYAQGWHLALYDEVLFNEDFEAWVHGPVIPELYHLYKEHGWNDIPTNNGEGIPSDLISFAQEVYNVYGQLSGDHLEKLSHSEPPWINARNNKKPWEAHDGIISKESMKEYFRSIYEQTKG